MAATDTDTDLLEPGTAEPVAASPEPRAPAPADAPAQPAKSKAKGKEKGKEKGKGKSPPVEAGSGPNVAAHPRAARAVERARAWGALAGFLLGGYLSLPTHTVADAMLRALLAGVICYVAVWAGALFVWRRLIVLELKAREQQLVASSAPRTPRPPAPPGGREQR
jgi:hypothetical protein